MTQQCRLNCQYQNNDDITGHRCQQEQVARNDVQNEDDLTPLYGQQLVRFLVSDQSRSGEASGASDETTEKTLHCQLRGQPYPHALHHPAQNEHPLGSFEQGGEEPCSGERSYCQKK